MESSELNVSLYEMQNARVSSGFFHSLAIEMMVETVSHSRGERFSRVTIVSPTPTSVSFAIILMSISQAASPPLFIKLYEMGVVQPADKNLGEKSSIFIYGLCGFTTSQPS